MSLAAVTEPESYRYPHHIDGYVVRFEVLLSRIITIYLIYNIYSAIIIIIIGHII